MMKAKDLNVSVNASSVNKSKDCTHLELLKTEAEAKEALQKQIKALEKTSPPKSAPKSNDNNDMSFSDINQRPQDNKPSSPKLEEPEKGSPQKIGNAYVDELVCEPSFCDNDSLEKHFGLKPHNSKEINDIIEPISILKQLGSNMGDFIIIYGLVA